MNITKDYADKLLNLMFDFDLGETEMRVDYSGRFMYGKECLAFVTDEPLKLVMTLTAVLALTERDAEDSGDLYEGIYWYDLNPRMDNMGLGTVVYFTNIQVEK